MEQATLKLTIGPDGEVTACLVAEGGVAPYELGVLADDIADAFNFGGIAAVRTRLEQISREIRGAR